MRGCERAKRVPGGHTSSAHDRACLYIRRRAAEFLQRVRPVDGGYVDVRVTMERPFRDPDARIVGYVDLAITGVPIGRAPAGDGTVHPDCVFIEVKAPGESIGDVLRQFQFYQQAHETERTYACMAQHDAYGVQGFRDYCFCFRYSWVLATTGSPPSGDARVILGKAGIMVVELAPSAIL